MATRTEEAKKVSLEEQLEEDKKKRVESCVKEIAESLKKYRCALACPVTMTVDQSGHVRAEGIARVFAIQENGK